MKRVLLIATLVLAMLGAFLYVLGGTEPGLRWLAARVVAQLPEGSRLDRIRGYLLGPIDIENARFAIGGQVVEIGHAHFEWTPSELLHTSLHLSRVDASDVRLLLAPAAAGSGSAAPLPVSIQVDALAIDRFDIVPTPASEPVRVDRLTLAATLDAAGITVHSLDARGLGVHAQGEIAVGATTPLSARIAWDYSPPGLPPMVGELRAHGEGNAIAIEQSLDAPWNLGFQGTFDPHARRVQGRLRTDALALDALRPEWVALAIQGTADIDGTLDGASAEVEGMITLGDGTPVDVRATLAADREQLTITRATVHATDLAVEGQGHTSLRELFGGTPLAQLPLAVDLGALDVNVPRFGHVRGEAHLSGSFARHELSGLGQIETLNAVNGTWTLAAHGESRLLTIDTVGVELAKGRGEARGTLDWRTSPQLQLQATIRHVDPGALWRDASGRLDADGSFTVQPGTRSFSFTLDSLSGRLRGQWVTGQGSVRYAEGAWRVASLDLAAGDAHFSASGEVAERSALTWRIEAPDLSKAIPGWSGSLQGNGRMTGSPNAPLLEGMLSASGFSTADMSASAVQGDWSIDLSGRAPSHGKLNAEVVVFGDRHFDSVRVEGGGPIGHHSIDVDVVSADARASLQVDGDWKDGTWRGEVARLDLQAPASGHWTLSDPSALLLSSAHMQLDSLCLQDDTSRSCVRFDWRSPRAWSGQATLEKVPLTVFSPFLPPALAYSGHVDGDIDVKGNGDTLTSVAGALNLDPGSIAQGDPPVPLLAWDHLQARAEVVKDQLVVKSSVDLASDAGQVTLEASLGSADLSRLTHAPIDGRIQGLVRNVPLIAALSPDLSELRGETRLDLRVAGTLVEPEIYGDYSIANGAATVPRLGITIQDVRFTLHGDGRTLEFDGEAKSGTGKIVFAGTLAPGDAGWQGNATISGQDFRLVDLPEASGDISPDVRVALNGRNLRVEGDVSVPRANIAPRDFAGAVRASPDAVIVGPEAAAQERSPWQLDAQLRLALGADVEFHGFGLDADIGGSVVATDRPGLPTTGTGELNVVQGTYTAYGRQLTIDHGRLLFNGGLIDNPALDARASRHVEAQSVGVDVRGTLRKPELKLYSDPPLSQTDALAYLLIGRPVGSLSGGEQAQLADTTRQIGISGAGFLAAQVGRRIGTEVGIEEVGFGDSNKEERTALFIGKYLSPKLYVGYGVGLFETVNTWRVRYFLTPRLMLQGESGSEHSADVIYSIDR